MSVNKLFKLMIIKIQKLMNPKKCYWKRIKKFKEAKI